MVRLDDTTPPSIPPLTMPWPHHPRPLPPDWPTTRQRILTRDHGICHICQQPGADQVDHRIPRWQGGPDTDNNLAAIHDDPCHKRKTAAEGHRARYGPSKRRPSEQHPGAL